MYVCYELHCFLATQAQKWIPAVIYTMLLTLQNLWKLLELGRTALDVWMVAHCVNINCWESAQSLTAMLYNAEWNLCFAVFYVSPWKADMLLPSHFSWTPPAPPPPPPLSLCTITVVMPFADSLAAMCTTCAIPLEFWAWKQSIISAAFKTLPHPTPAYLLHKSSFMNWQSLMGSHKSLWLLILLSH